ncbi:hypothetical protein ACEN2J_20060 [Pseudorhodobacter sp. W20_MBD10_FR17]|uniref:hypothetical protein n=1 Tax=Pseudorhodobacter sp. W20_MBD10_FR17 TaxID=3240266 RepID=UPI003F95D8A8
MAVLADHNVAFYDFSRAIPESRYYFDTDHLNRAGVQRFLDEALATVLQDDVGQDQ